MTLEQLERRLTALGFRRVDETPGFNNDLKWRHKSVLDIDRLGSLWVSEGEIHATGRRPGGYEVTLSRSVPPSGLDRLQRAMWRGKELLQLLDWMDSRKADSWPPVVT